MNRRTVLSLGCAVFLAVTMVLPARSAEPEARLDHINERIEQQMERIKATREKADAAMSLATIRAADQIRRSEEELTGQLEQLEQLRQLLDDQLASIREALVQDRGAQGSALGQALSRIDEQIRQTNAVINRMRAVRETMGDDFEAACDKGNRMKNFLSPGKESDSVEPASGIMGSQPPATFPPPSPLLPPSG